MAHPNCDERRQMVGRILSAGISIKEREARLLSVMFSCSPSAIKADVKAVRSTGDSDPLRVRPAVDESRRAH
jgi:hypothetical protein